MNRFNVSCSAILTFGLLAFPAGARPPEGNSNPILYQRATGEVPIRGVQIKYIFAVTNNPSGNNAQGGTIVAFVPATDLQRDPTTNEPEVELSDPLKGGDFKLKGPDGQLHPCTGREVARAVENGQLAPDSKILITLVLKLHCDEALRKQLLEGARVQVLKKVEAHDSASQATYRSGDLERIQNSVILLPTKKIQVAIRTPGFEGLFAEIDNNPTLSETMRIQGLAPAKFLSQFYSRGGLELSAHYVYDAYAESVNELNASSVVNDFVDGLLENHGTGGLTYDKAGGKSGEIAILVTRDRVQNLLRNSKWEKRVFARGSLEGVNALLALFQRDDPDIFAVTEKEIEECLRNNLDLEKMWNTPGIAESLEEASNKQSLTEREYEQFRSVVQSHSKRSSTAGGTAFFGLVSNGGGESTEELYGFGSKEQQRLHMKDFMSDLNTYRKTGKFPVHPKLDYRLVSKQKLQRRMDTVLETRLAGKVSEQLLSCPFSSARRTLPLAPTAPAPSREDVVRHERVREAADAALEEVEQLLAALKASGK